jgi:SAM-dependent methyltransferase
VWCCSTILAATAGELLKEAGVQGGLVVHLGCGDGQLTAALAAGEGFRIHGLAAEVRDVERARAHILSLGLYGKVTADRWHGKELPYIDNLVDLIVVSPRASVARDEMLRVLVPGGKAVFLNDQGGEEKSKRLVKPWPGDIDVWTHYLHGPDNNAVAKDKVVGPPRRMQWVAAPRWTRHHNYLNSVSAVVTSGGKLFCIVDEASPANMDLPGRWSLVARGAFNGILLWKKPMDSWAAHMHRFRSGPPQLPRLLVASGERVYVSLGLGKPVSALDAATGTRVATYADTECAEEIILSGNTLVLLKGNEVAEQALTDPAARKKFGFPAGKTLVAVDTRNGKVVWKWSPDGNPLPLTLASDSSHTYIRLDSGVVCLDLASGKVLWRHPGSQASKRKTVTWAQSNLLVVDGVVVCNLDGMLTALSATDGKKLWERKHGTNFHEPVDIFVIGGLVWHKVGNAADPMRIPPDKREPAPADAGPPFQVLPRQGDRAVHHHEQTRR